MEFRLILASNGLGGSVTNPVTGESYPCTWSVNASQSTVQDASDFSFFPCLIATGITIDITIDVDARFFRGRPSSERYGATVTEIPPAALVEHQEEPQC